MRSSPAPPTLLSLTHHWNCACSFVKVPSIYLSTCIYGQHKDTNRDTTALWQHPWWQPARAPTSLANTIPSGWLIKGNYSEIISCRGSDRERWTDIFASFLTFEVKCKSRYPHLNLWSISYVIRAERKSFSDCVPIHKLWIKPRKCVLYHDWAKTEIIDYITNQPPVSDFQKKMTN